MEEEFRCEVCRNEFSSLHKLNAHSECQHKEMTVSKKKNFKCNLCGYECSLGHYLIAHMRTHTGERPFKCKVIACGVAFKQESTLKNHINYKHSTDRRFKCDFPDCHDIAKTASLLEKHKIVHSHERPFACLHPGCSFRAKRRDDLSRHAGLVHTEYQTLTCSKCNFKTKSATNLAHHMMVHEGRNEKIPCSIEGCDYKGTHSRAFKYHVRRHKSNLPCPVSGCSRYAATEKALKSHLQLHKASGKAFQCPLCFKYFRTMDQLQQHCIVHTNEKPFHCGHCQLTSARQRGVKAHISSVHAAIEFPFIVHLLDDHE